MTSGFPDQGEGSFARERCSLVKQIEHEAEHTAGYTGRAVFAAPVMEAIATVPRHEFVPDIERASAYVNAPLIIGHGQTISQPFIVALMTDLLDTKPNHVVLEIGTGSGYQAAVLASLVRKVYSIEVVAALASQVTQRLARLGYYNIEVRHGDGALGWPEHSPFDGIIVTACAFEVPPALLVQLKPGGRLLVPVSRGWGQELRVVQKSLSGQIVETSVLPVAFVPMVRPERADHDP